MASAKKSLADLACFGGPPLFSSPRITGQLSAPALADFNKALRGLRNHQADAVVHLEDALADYHQVDHCCVLANACYGLMFLLALNRRGARNQVLLPSFSYRGLPHLVRWTGQRIGFCDVQQLGHTLCPASVERMIDESTSSVLCVHNVHALADVDRLHRIAREHGAQLVIDSVYALGSHIAGRAVGAFGQGEVFSLHATKLLHGFEGGYVTTNDTALDGWLRKLRSGHTVSRTGKPSVPGLPAGLHPWHAACALLSLKRLDETRAANARRYRRYQECFADIPGTSFVRTTNETSNHGLVLLRLDDDFPLSRAQVVQLLRAEGALVRPYYDPPLHEANAAAVDRIDSPMQVTNAAARQFLQLPVGELMGMEDIDHLADLFRFLASNAGQLRDHSGELVLAPTA